MTNPKRRRAYIGNLRPRPTLAQNLYNDLFVPHCLSINNYPNGDGITIVRPKIKTATVHAFVEFSDVDYAIQMLDGVQFDGKTLKVSREKTYSAAPNPTRGNIANEKSTDCDLKTDEEVAEEVRQVISKEIADGPDQITSAIACTAAMSLLSSVDAFGLDRDEKHVSRMMNQTNLHQMLTTKAAWPTKTFTAVANCHSPSCSMNMENRTWSGKRISNAQPATSVNGSRRKDFADKSNDKPIISDNGMLAPFGKAFIRLELVSFGYKYGAPPHSKKGFTYAHPLPPIDVRDLERAPANVAKFNGLSYLVKRALLNPSENNGDGNNVDSGEGKGQEMESDKRTPPTQSPMRRRANKIADEIIKVLVESIDEGGHGPISPLTMTISIGSEYGRHRAVVLVEHLAVILRARLRRNDGRGYNENEVVSTVQNGIVRQLVSVDTRHRDVDAHHMDEEAFGEDLKREVRAAEKARRRQERDDDHW
eukprot:CCRYP_018540-RA/>CCRYP_018540-RA protein AED:0.10 eAED:0.12 QI:0/0/0/1/0/0.33/3/0/477